VTSPAYGGQAVIEGVMIRGATAVAVAVRSPEGDVIARTERLNGILASSLRHVPFLRGIVVLWETLALGIRALTWSAAVAAGEVDEHGRARPIGILGWMSMGATMTLALLAFFAGPAAATAWLSGHLGPVLAVIVEGLLRIGLLLGYIWLIGRSSDVQRVFQYHGAEHMTIAALEDGRELGVATIRRYAKEHPRCGTSFLLTVAVISIVVFIFAGTEPFWWLIASRILFVPLVAATGYELIRFAGTHQRLPVVRWLFAGNLALQRLTTRVPDDEQIQVAVIALERVRAEEAALVPRRVLEREAEAPPLS
jgi:uncharacterized protein YqhQ